MSRTVRRWRDADRDILELARHIARDSEEIALRFFDAVEETIAGLAEMPGKGVQREFRELRLFDVRSYAVKGFPNHLVFYRPFGQGIDVIAVIHGARDIPTALRGRSEPVDQSRPDADGG